MPNGDLFFVADEPGLGAELWRIDSNAIMPRLVADIYQGALPSDIGSIHPYGDYVYFGARAGCVGYELFSANSKGAELVVDANLLPISSIPSMPFATDNFFCFTARSDAAGREVFVSDGTGVGTELLKDHTPGRAGNAQMYAARLEDKIYFVADKFSAYNDVEETSLFVTDGTRNGTREIITIKDRDAYFGDPFVFQERIILSITAFNRSTIYAYSPEGQTLDTLSQEFTRNYFFGHTVVPLNEGAFLVPSFSPQGAIPFISDGTKEGTRPLLDLVGNNIINGMNFKNLIFYGKENSDEEKVLYRTDGTLEGTFQVSGNNYSSVQRFMDYLVLNDTLYFVSSVGGKYSLFGTDGTPDGFFQIAVPDNGSVYLSDNIEQLNGDIYLAVSDVNGKVRLHRSNEDKTELIKVSEIEVGPRNLLAEIIAVDSFIYFNGYTEEFGAELYKSDGTEGGTIRLTDINPGASSANPAYLLSFKNAIYFAATEGELGIELWRYSLDSTVLDDPLVDSHCPLIPTHVATQNASARVKVFPNPAEMDFQLELPGNRYKINMYDQLGVKMKEIDEFVSGGQISVRDMISGVYFLHLRDLNSGAVLIKKVLVQR